MATAFPDVKPFPSAPQAGPGAPLGHNRPPLEESIVMDFKEAIENEPHLIEKIDALLARKDAIVAQCVDADQAGKYGDGCKQIAACKKLIEGHRETLNRPLLTAQRNLKGAADKIIGDLAEVDAKLRQAIGAYQREEDRKADALRVEAERQAQAARDAAAAAAAENPEAAPEPLVDIAPVHIEQAPIRGDFGAKVGTTTTWKAEVKKVRQLPDRILNNARVIEAINKVLAAEVRAGAREIKGARIWEEKGVAIR